FANQERDDQAAPDRLKKRAALRQRIITLSAGAIASPLTMSMCSLGRPLRKPPAGGRNPTSRDRTPRVVRDSSSPRFCPPGLLAASPRHRKDRRVRAPRSEYGCRLWGTRSRRAAAALTPLSS